MVDLEFLLRERGTEVDATWDPVTASEIFARADQVETQATPTPSLRARVRRWHPMTVAVVAGVAALLLFLPILLLISTQPVADDPPVSTVPVPTTVPGSADDLVLYTNVEDGYEVMLPRSWVASTTGPDGGYFEAEGLWSAIRETGGDPYPGVRRFGSDYEFSVPAMTISIGQADGSVMSCGVITMSDCESVVLKTLSEVETHFWHQPMAPEESRCEEPGSPIDTQLGGLPARRNFLPVNGDCGSFAPPDVVVQVYTVRDGRPVILTFHKGTLWDLQSEGEAIIESFRFLEPEAEPEENLGDLVIYTNVEDGYELRLPESWVAGATGPDGSYTEPSTSSESYQGVRRFGTVLNGNPDRSALTISIGEPDGSVHSCVGPRIRTCDEASLDDIEEMREFLASEEQAICSGSGIPEGSLIESETVLGDDTAQVMWLDSIDGRCRAQLGGGVMVWGSALGSHHIIYTILDGRPVILAFDRTTVDTLAFRSDLAAILESFRFLEPEAAPEESAGDLVLYTNEDDGYEVLLPESWVATATGYSGVRRFGQALFNESRPALTISIGGSDGPVYYCLVTTCQDHEFEDIDEMREFLVTSQEVWCVGPNGLRGSVVQSETTLGGEPAGVLRLDSVNDVCRVPSGSGFMMFGSIRGSHHIVYTMHDGEPVILAFDRMTVGTFAGSRRELPTILESFRFLEGSS